MITQRYSQDQFVVLAFHGGASVPLANLYDSTWIRSYSWYPRQGGLTESLLAFGRKQLGPVLPEQTLYTPEGDTLRGRLWVNGKRLLEETNNTPFMAQEGAVRIDDELDRAPEALVDLSVD